MLVRLYYIAKHSITNNCQLSALIYVGAKNNSPSAFKDEVKIAPDLVCSLKKFEL